MYSKYYGELLPYSLWRSDANDQIMIEFRSIIVCSITTIIGVPWSWSWSSRASMIWSICSIMGTTRSCSTTIEYTRQSSIMTDHSAHLSNRVMRWTYIQGHPRTRCQFFRPEFTLPTLQQTAIMTTDVIRMALLPSFLVYGVQSKFILWRLANTANDSGSATNYRDT